jgi:chromosome segregation ATPase
MKVQSLKPHHKGKTVLLNGENVSFDINGVADVPNEIYEKYSADGWLIKEGEKPKEPALRPDTSLKDLHAKLNLMTNKNAKLEVRLVQMKSQLHTLRENERMWRETLQKMMEDKDVNFQEVREKVAEVKKQDSQIEQLEKVMKELSKEDLPDYLKEIGLPADEIDHLKTKKAMIEYALDYLNN